MDLSLHFDKGTIVLKGVEDENLLFLMVLFGMIEQIPTEQMP